ncbi:stage II sporulation protein M [Bacillus cereus]
MYSSIFLILVGAYYYTDPTASKNLLNIEVVPSFNHIFLNNVKVALLLIFLAPLTLGFGTIIILVINALVLGSFCGSIKK